MSALANLREAIEKLDQVEDILIKVRNYYRYSKMPDAAMYWEKLKVLAAASARCNISSIEGSER
jgi:hypothetical protein